MTDLKLFRFATAALLVLAVGCGKSESGHDDHDDHDHDKTEAHDDHEGHDDHGAEGHDEGEKDAFAALGAEDAKLAKAQGKCPVTGETLGGKMGTPVKVMVGDKPVFICCPSCKKKLLADPDKYLAKLAK